MVTQSTSHLKDGLYSNRIQEYTEKQRTYNSLHVCVSFPQLLQQVTTQPLTTAPIYPSAVLEARSPTSESLGQNQGCQPPSRGSIGEPAPCLFPFLVAAGFHWLMGASLQSPPLWSHYLLLFCLISLCFMLISTLVITFRILSNNKD